MARTILTIGTALLLFCGSAAVAQQRPLTRAMAKACVADLKSVCGSVQPGGGRIGLCIKSHLADLSETCQNAVSKAATVAKACKADVKQLCAGKKSGVQLAACMKSHLNDSSNSCKNALSQSVAGKR